MLHELLTVSCTLSIHWNEKSLKSRGDLLKCTAIYKIRSKLSCDSKNIIYLASCKKCRLQYIGSTTTDFRVRFRNHKSAMVTKKKTCEVAVHCHESPLHLSDFSFQCIDKVQETVNNSCSIEKLLITKEAVS